MTRLMTGVRPALYGIGIAAGGWAVGVGLRDSVLVGLVTTALVLTTTAVFLTARGPGQRYRWPARPPQEAPGARREVMGLTWAFVGAGGMVSEEAIRRLRADATRRLARCGVVLPGELSSATPRTADPGTVARARSLLGEHTWVLLTSPGGRMPPLAHVARCIEALEHLGEAATPARSPEGNPS